MSPVSPVFHTVESVKLPLSKFNFQWCSVVNLGTQMGCRSRRKDLGLNHIQEKGEQKIRHAGSCSLNFPLDKFGMASGDSPEFPGTVNL